VVLAQMSSTHRLLRISRVTWRNNRLRWTCIVGASECVW
jgi:hypothetical protein